MLPRRGLAPVKSNGLAVFAQTHQAVAKIGLAPLLPVVQANQPAPDVMGKQAAHCAISNGHPHHIARNRHHLRTQCEADAARYRPQNTDEGHQRDRGIEQPHAHAQGAAGKAGNVFLNALVGVVGYGVGAALAQQFQVVVAVIGQPGVHVVPRHPGAPAQIQPLRDVELVYRQHNGCKRQYGKQLHLLPKHIDFFLLQGVIKHPVPLVELHTHIHSGQVQRQYQPQHGTCTPFVFGVEIRHGQAPGTAQKAAPAATERINACVGVRVGRGCCHGCLLKGHWAARLGRLQRSSNLLPAWAQTLAAPCPPHRPKKDYACWRKPSTSNISNDPLRLPAKKRAACRLPCA